MTYIGWNGSISSGMQVYFNVRVVCETLQGDQESRSTNMDGVYCKSVSEGRQKLYI